MEAKDLQDKIVVSSQKVVIAKKKKKGGYTIYPQVVDCVQTYIPMVGLCYAIVFED
jgi:hypothetical protein